MSVSVCLCCVCCVCVCVCVCACVYVYVHESSVFITEIRIVKLTVQFVAIKEYNLNFGDLCRNNKEVSSLISQETYIIHSSPTSLN